MKPRLGGAASPAAPRNDIKGVVLEYRRFKLETKNPVVIKLKNGDKYQRLLGGSPQTAGMRSGHVNLMPGQEIGEHSTDNREEAIIILKGKAQVLSEKSDPITVESESLVYIPANTKHNIKNIGQDVLRYVYVVCELK